MLLNFPCCINKTRCAGRAWDKPRLRKVRGVGGGLEGEEHPPKGGSSPSKVFPPQYPVISFFMSASSERKSGSDLVRDSTFLREDMMVA